MKFNRETRILLHELQKHYDSIEYSYESYYPKKVKNKNHKKRKAAKLAKKARKINKRHQK